MENKEIKVLDHGYVRLVETYGQDSSIIEAARMSTNKGFEGWSHYATTFECSVCDFICTEEAIDNLRKNGSHLDAVGLRAMNQGIAYCPTKSCLDTTLIEKPAKVGDEKLLKYLYDHKHATPFEFCGMIIEVQAPIFVFREWHRHRTQSYNEMSARYTPLPDVNYMPTMERLFLNAGTNKQAQGTGEELNNQNAEKFLRTIEQFYKAAESIYQESLVVGIPKEIARVILPVGRYSRMRASANLRNWLAFLTLRMDENAQWEIRQFANAVGELISEAFPKTWELFDASRNKE